MQFLRPRWIRDLLRFLPLRSQFVLSGNVRDQYPVEVAPGVVVPLYGVEFSAPAAGTAFQTRVVAVGEQQRSSQRDREVEETWCSEFARLRALLAEGGCETNLAQAHQPGAIPIKTVASREANIARNRVIEGENLSRPAGS